ncbi:S49 family peptidase [Alteromonas pelagimontana]|uniref:S49 family peptidase n=1 Tax=Alteromonas pelagimontana TaxID=1858656 RepID=A0A6M4M8V9_9ALTE|nr:S49 family peptidase [Alteromonas pelagimontana]QJR79612.1 S49 family peptidase [Alteromonas pelagimontana]
MLETLLNQSLAMDAKSARLLLASLAVKQKGGLSLFDEKGVVDTEGKPRVSQTPSAYHSSHGGYANKPYYLVDGVAVIPVSGALIHKLGFVSSYISGYDAIVAMFDAANQDPDVKGILLSINSPGGTVAGCFDACDHIFENKQKPLWAIYDDMACSAAMCIGSAADKRFTTQTAISGSIGVVQIHSSYEGMLSEYGMEITMIYSGSHKVDGNPYKNLPDDVYQQFKSSCDELREQFAGKVSRNIGLSLDEVLATEALSYTGQAAVDAGLADEVINSHNILTHFTQHLSGTDSQQQRSITMSEQATPAADETVSAGPEAQQQASPAASAPAVDQKQRCAAILKAPEAEGRSDLAQHLAFNTDLSAEDAVAVMKASPESKSAAQGNALDIAMSATEQPGIGAIAEAEEESEAAKYIAAYNKSVGVK